MDMNYFKDEFSLEMTDGTKMTLERLKKENFVLYFYPKDNTSACTLEALSFSELYDEFREQGFHIYGVSKDTLKSHEKFREKNNLPYHLISDVDKVLLEWFDVIKEKKMYGKLVKGTERSTFIYMEGLVLKQVFRNVKAKDHAKEVLDYIIDKC
jgi:peroxiredoxin Q/BCP